MTDITKLPEGRYEYRGITFWEEKPHKYNKDIAGCVLLAQPDVEIDENEKERRRREYEDIFNETPPPILNKCELFVKASNCKEAKNKMVEKIDEFLHERTDNKI